MNPHRPLSELEYSLPRDSVSAAPFIAMLLDALLATRGVVNRAIRALERVAPATEHPALTARLTQRVAKRRRAGTPKGPARYNAAGGLPR